MATRGKLPPLNALRAFEAAARHLSFKAAAEELCVTSTAISHQIRHLESLVGMRLFDRTPRAISLTEPGRRLFPVLRDGFDRLAQAVGELSEVSHSISVSVTPAFASKILIPSLAGLHDAHPEIQLTVDATERLADVARGEVDLAVRYGPPADAASPALAPGLRAVPLYTDRYFACASPAWVAGRALPIAAAQLSNERLLSYAWKNPALRGPTWPRWMQHAAVAGFDEGRCVLFSEESHALQAAIDGAGVALVSNLLVSRDEAAGRLLRVCAESLDGLQYQCVSRADNPKIETLRRVEGWLAGLMPVVE